MKKKRILILGAAVVLGVLGFFLWSRFGIKQPEERLSEYVSYIGKKDYEAMYGLLDKSSRKEISKKEFIQRNQKIYQGIEAKNIKISVDKDAEGDGVSYHMSLDTLAGKISFKNKAYFVKEDGGYYLKWDDSMIFPDMEFTDKVRVSKLKGERGEIYDRNKKLLAGKGKAASIGIVPGKMKSRKNSVSELAGLLNIKKADINKKLDASWVTKDSFVPVKKMTVDSEEKIEKKLLKIPGVLVSSEDTRVYPYGKAAAHLTGYVQEISADDLKKLKDKGYKQGQLIGKSGLEVLYEDRLHETDGYKISIFNEDGREKKVLAVKKEKNGETIYTTIDAGLQAKIYDQYKNDKSCSVMMNPKNGEILALVSTPSYDSNDFVLGISSSQWKKQNSDKAKPLYNRFRQKWAPGSIFKPVVAGMGMNTGKLKPGEDFGNSGLSWQKDSSWGSYKVTTLHTYENAVLRNALIYSDNIYFAKAALKIGAKDYVSQAKHLGFGKEMPFDIKTAVSQFSNNQKSIDTEVQLADSGYGQGQVLVNPIHLASVYSAFVNEGNMIRPYLLLKEKPEPKYWIKNAFSKKTAAIIKDDLVQVIEHPSGTGHGAKTSGVKLAGKTGTAEIKASKDDTTGTELGWFGIFTADKKEKEPWLLITMAEDVKDRGGSGYVVGRTKAVIKETLTR
ncbi:penicillin-binding transpeptidase domain-containing protein [Anaerostipes sp.]|uniref:penicillin-binding transpeptidase domain-containing protein n=1 Tax=Anaerostipes sp. TaxID=1872530 RepID=UPI0025BF882A|nr:penicillin-binding transpeptidase domain-containing protein [Anaerostipes sp.]MBS7007729.1 penicillin-binding transpeptidase domain-containing protein [Anaerostipes sp.]